MAQDSIISGLFGLTPEAYQESQRRQELQEAIDFAKLDPYQRASVGYGIAARGLGRGISSLLGVEDPQLKMIAQQQEILRGINQTDPKSIAEGIKKASEMGNPRLANVLSDLYRKTVESAALTAQRLAAARKEQKSTVPTSIQEAQYLADLNAQKQEALQLPDSPERQKRLDNINTQIKQIEKIISISYGTDSETVAKELFYTNFANLTQDQVKEVNRVVQENKRKLAKARATIIPGMEKVIDLPKTRREIQATIKPDLDVIRATQQALEQLEISMKKNNFASFNAARVQLARAISGGGDLAIREIQAAGGDPSLIGKFADVTSTLFTGTPPIETQQQIKDALIALKSVATSRANNEIQTQRDLAIASGFKQKDIDKVFNFKELKTVAPQNLTPQEAAKAELEKRRAQNK